MRPRTARPEDVRRPIAATDGRGHRQGAEQLCEPEDEVSRSQQPRQGKRQRAHREAGGGKGRAVIRREEKTIDSKERQRRPSDVSKGREARLGLRDTEGRRGHRVLCTSGRQVGLALNARSDFLLTLASRFRRIRRIESCTRKETALLSPRNTRVLPRLTFLCDGQHMRVAMLQGLEESDSTLPRNAARSLRKRGREGDSPAA